MAERKGTRELIYHACEVFRYNFCMFVFVNITPDMHYFTFIMRKCLKGYTLYAITVLIAVYLF